MAEESVLIAIGANLPDAAGRAPLAACRAAAAGLDGVAGLRLVAVSRWYRSAPVPPSGQPDFVNGVARLTGTADPAVLLAALQAMEARAGRVRGAVNAARPLDLDIVAMGARVRDAPDPVLPHPRAHARAFVLRPLLDVAPGWIHPRLGLGAAALLARLPTGGIDVIREG
jgi:2-amino-4-hydroxy-6-hydroxymethyldihydropteridine diphosphokinase